LEYLRTYFWDVRGRNALQEAGPRSERWEFTTRAHPVETAVTLMSPGNGATGRALLPTFEWANVAHADDYVLQLYVFRSATGQIEPVGGRQYIVERGAGATTVFRIADSSTNPDPLDGSRTYYWDVTPRNVQDAEGPISARWSFTTRAESVTVAPTLVNPSNGANRARVNPTFEWTNVPHATEYVLQLYVDTPNNAVARRNFVVPAAGGTTTSFTFNNALPNQDDLEYSRTYYWDVVPRNADQDAGPRSAKWSFTTRPAPVVVAPTLINPTNGAVNRQLSPSFEWANVPHAVDYVLQLYVVRSGQIEPIDRRRYVVPRDAGANTVFSFAEANHDTDPLEGNRLYYWDVVGRNVDGERGPISARWSFTTRASSSVLAPPPEGGSAEPVEAALEPSDADLGKDDAQRKNGSGATAGKNFRTAVGPASRADDPRTSLTSNSHRPSSSTADAGWERAVDQAIVELFEGGIAANRLGIW
jgi:hypothetical protein